MRESDIKHRRGKRIAYKLLHIKHRLGIEDQYIYHIWNILIIFDCLGKYFLYETNLFGHYTLRRGLLSIYSTVYPGMAILILYLVTLLKTKDVAWWMVWVYKMQVFTLWGAILLYGFDAILFLSN